MIRLEKINENNYRECLGLKVADHQNDFVSSNAVSLTKAYVYYDSTTPFAIYDDDTMVGFIMIRHDIEYDWTFIWQFMIDERYQGNGFGKEALKLTIDWIKSILNCNQIITTYKKINKQIDKLYSDFGFVFHSEEEDEVNMLLNIKSS